MAYVAVLSQRNPARYITPIASLGRMGARTSNIKYTFHSFPNSLAVAHECPSKIGISKKVICEATR